MSQAKQTRDAGTVNVSVEATEPSVPGGVRGFMARLSAADIERLRLVRPDRVKPGHAALPYWSIDRDRAIGGIVGGLALDGWVPSRVVPS